MESFRIWDEARTVSPSGKRNFLPWFLNRLGSASWFGFVSAHNGQEMRFCWGVALRLNTSKIRFPHKRQGEEEEGEHRQIGRVIAGAERQRL